jgi:xanthine dehydrogenase small subunit
MIRFILNEKEVNTQLPPGTLLLDFVRYHKNLTGTKIGCREGDCGACTVLIGEIINGQLTYRSMTSCLLALGNIHHKHVVTVEGVNMELLNPIQQSMSDEGATQCGFCTPGFIVSLSGFCLSHNAPTYQNAIAAIDGNICRCTGYKSIERAAARLVDVMKDKKEGESIVDFVTQNKILPEYFKEIETKLCAIQNSSNGALTPKDPAKFLGGGTDLYVQQHDAMVYADINFLYGKSSLKGIKKEGNKCIMGAAATVTDILESPIFDHFPGINKFIELVSSTPIRNMATIAGNFINASPIGDFTIFFLALDAQLIFSDGENERNIPLRKLYKGYKDLNKLPEEFIKSIEFNLPDKNMLFNFEKVSKRTHLDIASVNTAISLRVDKNIIVDASLSAGGIGPIPLYLSKASSFLKDKIISEELIFQTIEIANEEISPMSDARGSKEYKTLLLGQLIKAHFITLFPKIETEKLMHYQA